MECGNSFFSKKLKPAETQYSAFDWELLAVYLAIKHLMESQQFYHKPLLYALSSRSDRASPGQVHHLDYILQFMSDIWHIRGVDNAVVDALSRVDIAILSQDGLSTVNFKEMAATQQDDPDLQAQSSSSLDLKPTPLPTMDGTSSVITFGHRGPLASLTTIYLPPGNSQPIHLLARGYPHHGHNG